MPVSKNRNRVCQECGVSYTLGVESSQHKYCSIKCRNSWQNKHAGKRYRNSEHGKRTIKGWRLSREFGISHEIYDEMLSKQNNSCAICLRTSPTGYGWHVDHCHTTKKVRGLLCSKCNQGLGLFEDSLTSLRKAIEYLEN
jgi:Recombination endonuclease VII